MTVGFVALFGVVGLVLATNLPALGNFVSRVGVLVGVVLVLAGARMLARMPDPFKHEVSLKDWKGP